MKAYLYILDLALAALKIVANTAKKRTTKFNSIFQHIIKHDVHYDEASAILFSIPTKPFRLFTKRNKLSKRT